MQALRAPPRRGATAPTRWSDVAVLLVRDAEIKQLQARMEWLQKACSIMTKLNGSTAKDAARRERGVPARTRQGVVGGGEAS